MSDGKVLGLGALAFAIFIALLIVVFNAQDNACADKGGHMVNIYKSRICVSEDGRILE